MQRLTRADRHEFQFGRGCERQVQSEITAEESISADLVRILYYGSRSSGWLSVLLIRRRAAATAGTASNPLISTPPSGENNVTMASAVATSTTAGATMYSTDRSRR